MRSWIVHDILEALGDLAESILEVLGEAGLLSRRGFWIFALALAGLLAAIAAAQFAIGHDAMTASMLGLVAATCALAAALLVVGRKSENR